MPAVATVPAEISVEPKKFKAAEPAVATVPAEVSVEPKKIKAAKPALPDVDEPSPQEPIVDCRQMPFKGIRVKT